jgi:hypothetical protein
MQHPEYIKRAIQMTKATHIAKCAVFIALCVLLASAGSQSYVGNNYSLQTTDRNTPSRPKDGALLAESPGLETWHHDCSNMTSFANQTDNTWALDEGPTEHNVVNGDLESTGSYIYPTDLASGDDWHGPLYYYELENQRSLSDFIELRAAMEIGSTAENELARLDIILNDQNHAPIMGFSVHDGWAGDDAILPEAYWMFANGSFIRINEGYENSVQSTYNESLRAWQNSTGFFVNLPQVGAFKLVDQDQVDLGRSIRYVSIHAMKWQTNPPCPVMRIHDVVLNWNSSNRVTWLHDCSNITAFNGIGDHTWSRLTSQEVTQGTLSSTSGYIYASDYGTGTDAYGPLHYHTLGVSFQVSQFLSLEAEIEIDSTVGNRRGEITVSLHDETNKTILSLSVYDLWVSQDDVTAFGTWRFSNYSTRVTPNLHPANAANQSYHESIRIFQNSTGIFFDAPRIGSFKVVDIASLKLHRIVNYISLHFQGVNDGFGTDICETIRVHNLELTWNNASIVQEPESFIWHDNCAESHNWIYDLDWDGWVPWGISSGTLQTTAGYLHASVDSDVATGPFWYKALDTPANLTNLYKWKIDVQVTQPEESYKGPFAAILYDQNREPIVWFHVYEFDGGAYNLNLYIHYRFENGTYSTHSRFNITDPDWMGTLRIGREWGQGLVATIPSNGTGLILSEANLLTDSHRQISYVGIQWRRGSGNYLAVKLHDISITTTTKSSLVGPSITLSSPSNGTVQSSEALVGFDVSDESGVSHVLASWDGNTNISLSYPFAATQPSGDGQHILDIYSNDTLNIWSTETYAFVIDDTDPVLDSPNDVSYSEGASGNTIVWNPTDIHPLSYSAEQNGTIMKSGSWNSTMESVTISIDGLTLGVYNYTVVATDEAGNSISDMVLVTVYDGTVPSIDEPLDIVYEYGTTGHSVTWNPSDLHPEEYQCFLDGTPIESGLWRSSGETIDIGVDSLGIGVYNLTLVVIDIGGNRAVNMIWVTVEDTTVPVVDHPVDIEYSDDLTGNEIIWNPSDSHPFSHQILRNGSTIRSGGWDGSAISIDIDGLTPGVYNYTLVVTDTSGNWQSDEVIVTVSEATALIVGSPPDIQVSEGDTDSIIWHPTGSHPGSYEILRNDSLVKSGSWNSSSETITVSLEGLLPGVWNYTLVLTDIAGNVVVDMVFVTVLPVQIQPWDASSMIAMVASIGGGGLVLIGLVGYFLIVKPRRRRDIAEPSETQATPASAGPVESDVIVQALRGGEFVGNRFRFKVKVLNKSPFVITDITVGLISYPKDTLRIEGDAVKTIAKLEPNGYRSPTFDFLPTEDCVKGDIIASVSYVDSRGNAHSITTKPFTIRAVCDLLRPESISPEGFMLKLAALGHGEMMSRVEDWTPEEMHEKTLNILRDSNFFEVTRDLSQVGENHVESKIKGWAKGIYTGNNLGVQVTITGRPGVKGATCKVRMSGEDEAMIMPAIDEISQKLGAWLCPRCSGTLPVELVNELKAGKSVSCPFCSVTMDR